MFEECLLIKIFVYKSLGKETLQAGKRHFHTMPWQPFDEISIGKEVVFKEYLAHHADAGNRTILHAYGIKGPYGFLQDIHKILKIAGFYARFHF